MRAFGRRFLENLPTLHYNVFVYWISFLREILKDRTNNNSTVEALRNISLSCLSGGFRGDADNGSTTNVSKEEAIRREMRLHYLGTVIDFFLTASEF